LKQILQSLETGAAEIAEVPCPEVVPGQLLIRSHRSLISTGTERMLINFGKANLITKARQQPDKVLMVLDKVKTDGLLPTLDTVRKRLEQPLLMGYCNVGSVLEVGQRVTGFIVGDRVASNGRHAEVVSVPLNLCARIPNSVSDESAAFTVIGAIALQGIRLVQPTLGEVVVVTGLGLVGQIAVQLLRANGCRVLGIDFDPAKLELAKSFGAEVVNLGAGEDPVKAAELFSRGRGVDAVLVTATTKSSEPIHQAAVMCRKRGRIVLVGVTGLDLSRDDFFKKELTFQVSASYGPGRYDKDYEENGQDYPVGFVRWTEQRNFEAVLDMMAEGRINVEPLISHRFNLREAEAAYAMVSSTEPSMGILLEYSTREEKSDVAVREPTVHLAAQKSLKSKRQEPSIAFIGSGNYASGVLIPAFKEAGAYLASVASAGGVSGMHAGKKYGFDETTTDTSKLFKDPNLDALVITTRHDSHARFVLQALEAGKHLFVEKPLCVTLEELNEIELVYTRLEKQDRAPLVMVGFNRRFSPHLQKIKSLLTEVSGPKSFVMTVNAGEIPSDHWVQDTKIGGGRIIGEGCHFIDLLRFLADCPIIMRSRAAMNSAPGDTMSLQLGFADGSIGTVHYFANGCKSFPKERLEVFAAGRVLQMDNFRKLRGFGWPKFSKFNLWSQNKGQRACAAAFIHAIRNGTIAPIPFAEIVEVTRVSIDLATAP
jgi:predicted dehydrogenase/threonine dehydrogenase-like Zn-dependent dehydrogenase